MKKRFRLRGYYEVIAYMYDSSGDYLSHLHRSGFSTIAEVEQELLKLARRYNVDNANITLSCSLLGMRKEYVKSIKLN